MDPGLQDEVKKLNRYSLFTVSFFLPVTQHPGGQEEQRLEKGEQCLKGDADDAER